MKGREDEEDNSLPECSICLMDVNVGDKCRILPHCNHLFHSVCVDAWFKCSVCCPLCKRSMREILNNGASTAISSFESDAPPLSIPRSSSDSISAASSVLDSSDPHTLDNSHALASNSTSIPHINPVTPTAPTVTAPAVVAEVRIRTLFGFSLFRSATYSVSTASTTTSRGSVGAAIVPSRGSVGAAAIVTDHASSGGGLSPEDRSRDTDRDRDRIESRGSFTHLDIYDSVLSNSNSAAPSPSRRASPWGSPSQRRSTRGATGSELTVRTSRSSMDGTTSNRPVISDRQNADSVVSETSPYIQRAVSLSSNRSIYTGNHGEDSMGSIEKSSTENEQDRDGLLY